MTEITLEGIRPEVETVYVFKIEDGPIVPEIVDAGRIKVETVTVHVYPDGFEDVTVKGRKVLKDGRDDPRTHYDYSAKWEVVEEYRAAWEAYKQDAAEIDEDMEAGR